MWKWEQQEPFGSSAANDDPDADSVAFEFNLRFPGQYFDRETNLHYNYFRDYDPGLGRYGQSDSAGLSSSLNTYAYVDSDPLSWVDPEGMSKGGKRNIGAEGFNTKSDAAEVEAKLKEVKKNDPKNKKRIGALRGLLKVIKRGGTMGMIWSICEEHQRCQIDPCSCDPDSYACVASGT